MSLCIIWKQECEVLFLVMNTADLTIRRILFYKYFATKGIIPILGSMLQRVLRAFA